MNSGSKRRRSRGSACAAPTAFSGNVSLAAIVRAYVALHRPKARDELASFAAERTVGSAVRRAGLAQTPCGLRYDHQRRVPRAVLEAAASELSRERLDDAPDFDVLLGRVKATIGSILGIGELTVYDTALRIGARLGLLPTRVYLHSGTRQGARALGLNWRAPYLALEECPPEFRVLKPHEIEDCLCIYKDRFHRPSNEGMHPAAQKPGGG